MLVNWMCYGSTVNDVEDRVWTYGDNGSGNLYQVVKRGNVRGRTGLLWAQQSVLIVAFVRRA